MPVHLSSDISQAVFEALLYSDVFDFPLKAHEVHRYLPGRRAAYDQVYQALNSDPLFERDGDYFTLRGRKEIVAWRKEREIYSRKMLPYALTYGRVLGSLPFVRMVALTGSLAVGNVSNNTDFDYMLVTQTGRLWTTRACVLLFGRLTRLRGHILCPNVIVSENSLAWNQHDLYSARDLCQMIPISGTGVYKKMIGENEWVRDFLPNAYEELPATGLKGSQGQNSVIQKILEAPFVGKLGNHFEYWEMNRKITRFTRQEGFGDETIFNADICQGNFDHHRKRTQQELRKRAGHFNMETSVLYEASEALQIG